MEKNVIFTENAPSPVGPYSQGILVGNLFFSAGQIPIVPETGEIIMDNFPDAVQQTLSNLIAVVEAAGGNAESIVKITIFLRDMEKFSQLNQVFTKFFPSNPPARSAVEVCRLPKDVDIEMECIAII
jgi:2-iminobutanoate/2-iminopropanoate deaminase